MTLKPEWWTSDHWGTPPDLLRALETEFGAFDLDPCCTTENKKAPRFYTEQSNGLIQPWAGKIFLNPPYSRPAPWLAKALAEIALGRATLVVALLPVCTDTRWFHDLVLHRAELRFIKGRVRFIGWKGTPIHQPKSPNMLAIYRSKGDLTSARPPG